MSTQSRDPRHLRLQAEPVLKNEPLQQSSPEQEEEEEGGWLAGLLYLTVPGVVGVVLIIISLLTRKGH
jgi:hypothetical protein